MKKWGAVRFTVCVFFLFLAAGCAKYIVFDSKYKEGANPKLNERVVATTGSAILEEFSYQSAKAAILKVKVHQEPGLGLTFIVPAGMRCYQGKYENEIMYCSEQLTVRDGIGTLFSPTCFRDQNGDNVFDVITHNMAIPNGVWWDLDIVVPYKIEEVMANYGQGKRKELIYQGLRNDVIIVVYREYVDNLAKPSYSQEFQYKLNTFPVEISFRNSKIQVLSADSNKIAYVLKSRL